MGRSHRRGAIECKRQRFLLTVPATDKGTRAQDRRDRFRAEENAEESFPGAMDTSFLRAEARSVLAKHRVELSLIRVAVFGSVIRVQGVLRRAAGHPEMTHAAVQNLEQELRRVRGVQRIELHLSNWRREGSEWRTLETPALEP